MRRVWLVGSLVALVVAGSATPASAGKPTKEPLGADDLVIEDVCSFAVERTVLVNRSILKGYDDGTYRITGTFKQRLTNLDSRESVELNSSGPVVLVPNDDGTWTEHDRGGQFIRPPGELLITTGPVTQLLDADFNAIGYEQKGGTTRDVCEVLG